MTVQPAIDLVPLEMIQAIRRDASHFPSIVQSRGRSYVTGGRVGPLVIEESHIRTTVKGTPPHHPAWRWDGRHANPQCDCHAGPVCAHAYALAEAIDVARHDGRAKTAEEARARSRAEAVGDTRQQPVLGIDRRWTEGQDAPAPADLAEDLARWARRHAETPTRTLRAVLGIDADSTGRPLVWMEARLTTSRATDVPRSAQQVVDLASELRRDPLLLAPPHARLLRVLAKAIPQAEPLEGGTRFAIRSTAIHRLLDSFSDSLLATWGDAAQIVAGERAGILPRARLRLGDAALEMVPMCVGEGPEMRIVLAARWPDGRLKRLDGVVYIPADDDLHPSLVVADGAFWRLADEPPPRLVQRLAFAEGLPLPETGREKFIELLAASFPTVADALAPHIRVHRVRPIVTLDLGVDDWVRLRLFAHTDEAWRPGLNAPGAVGFELDAEGQWLRLGPDPGDEGGVERTRVDAPAGIAAAANGSPPIGLDEGADPLPPSWLEVPDAAQVESARAWLDELPTVRARARDAAGADPAPAQVDPGVWLRLTARNLNAFAEAWEQRPRDVLFLGNARMRHLLAEDRAVRPAVTVTASGIDWFTISAEWRSEGLALTEADLAKLRTARTRFVKLSSGWVRRDWVQSFDAAAEMLADLGLEAGDGEQRVTLAQLAQARPEHLAALEGLGVDPRTTREIERMRKRVRDFTGLPRVDLPKRLQAVLRPYQRDGLDFLAFVTGLGMGSILADDMGLGKTVQALAWIEWLIEQNPDGGPTLVVCPASVVHNWQREAERFTPELRVLALTSGERRHALRRQAADHDLVITNYALLRRDLEHWRAIPLRAAILDEAQHIKNPGAAVSRAVLELNAKHRLALTGTPIENRALDLWSIMQFVNPGYLGRRKSFVARYDRPDLPPHARRLLAARLRPVLVRRLKEQVAPDLPDRIEERRECELTPGQRKLYLAELMRGRETLSRLKGSPEGVMGNKIEILAAITRLRQVCCHPALVGGRESLGSGKFDALFEILEPLLAEGRKVLVFSQFVECLKLLSAEMKRRKIRQHMLTGATTRREAVVAAFETDPEPCAFLISLKAGGLGLNLTAASYVVLFDPWWNPSVEAQAIDRAHRIGQTRTVIAYRMLAAGTIEEKIWELQQKKEALVDEVLGEGGFARTLTPQDLDYLMG